MLELGLSLSTGNNQLTLLKKKLYKNVSIFSEMSRQFEPTYGHYDSTHSYPEMANPVSKESPPQKDSFFKTAGTSISVFVSKNIFRKRPQANSRLV